MTPYLLIPTLIGLMTIVQSTLNRQIGNQSGLATAILINGGIVFFSSLILVLAVRLFPERFSTLFIDGENTFIFHWWYIIPGIFGFCVILGLPFSIAHLGGLNVFICFITAQVVGSLVWDIMVDQVSISTPKIAGACLVLIGVLLVVWR